MILKLDILRRDTEGITLNWNFNVTQNVMIVLFTQIIIIFGKFFFLKCAVHSPCYDPSSCVNTIPGYQCSACPYGYTGSYEDALAHDVHLRVFEYETMNKVLSTVQRQQCNDVDECEKGLHICDINSACINTIVSSLYSFFC